MILLQRSLGYYFENHQVPFTLPPARFLILTGLGSILVCAAVGLAGALVPAWRTIRREPYDLVRGEGT
jgi:putative ABC transport system permease protein